MSKLLRLLASAALFAPTASLAQSREPFAAEPTGPLLRGDVAGSRQPAGMEPNGIHAGPLLIQPSVTAKVEADSNVFNRATDKRGDVFVVLAPAVKATGESGAASYVLRAEAAVARFASESSQNHETFGVEANGRLAISRRVSVFVRAGFDRKIEPVGSAGEAAVEGSPARYDQIEGQLATRLDAGAVRMTASATALRRSYAVIELANGTVADQAFRDSESLALRLKAEYANSAGVTLFAQGNYDWIDSIHPAPFADRSAHGARFVAGLRGDLSELVTAEIAAGYLFRNYDNPAFADFDGLTWRATIDWYATPLVSVSIASGRNIVSSGIADVPGVVVDTSSLQLFYELRRNLNVVAALSHSRENYREADTRARSTLAGIEARYLLNSRYATGLYTRLRWRSVSGSRPLRGGNGIEGGVWLRLSI